MTTNKPEPRPEPILPGATYIRAYLARYGHPIGKVQALSLANGAAKVKSLMELHGVEDREYRAAGGAL